MTSAQWQYDITTYGNRYIRFLKSKSNDVPFEMKRTILIREIIRNAIFQEGLKIVWQSSIQGIFISSIYTSIILLTLLTKRQFCLKITHLILPFLSYPEFTPTFASIFYWQRPTQIHMPKELTRWHTRIFAFDLSTYLLMLYR